MRILIENVINEKDAKKVLKLRRGKRNFDNPIIMKVLANIEEVIGNRGTTSPSYASVETRQKGHQWHKDTGSKDHMLWCNYGVSVLLKKAGKALFKYKNPDKVYPQDAHYLNAIVHSSDQWHTVEDATGGRTVLLMFLT